MLRFLLLFVIAAVSNLVAADLRGRWAGAMEIDGNPTGIVVTLSQQGQKLTGTIATSDDPAPAPIENAAIDGETVTFQMHDDANRIVKFRLALTGGMLSGEAGIGDRVAKVALSPASDAGFFPIAGGLLSSPPVLVSKVEPRYTEEARAAGIQGTVVMQVEIEPDGRATQYRVLKSLGLGLDQKAIEAVRLWKFKPATNNGIPVKAPATVEVYFRQ